LTVNIQKKEEFWKISRYSHKSGFQAHLYADKFTMPSLKLTHRSTALLTALLFTTCKWQTSDRHPLSINEYEVPENIL
jgi:hypothetical protein